MSSVKLVGSVVCKIPDVIVLKKRYFWFLTIIQFIVVSFN